MDMQFTKVRRKRGRNKMYERIVARNKRHAKQIIKRWNKSSDRVAMGKPKLYQDVGFLRSGAYGMKIYTARPYKKREKKRSKRKR